MGQLLSTLCGGVALSLVFGCGQQDPANEDGAVPTLAPPYGFEGLWAHPAADCREAPGTSDRAPILLTSDGFDGGGERCDFLSVSGAPEREGAFEVVQECRAGDEVFTDTLSLRYNGDLLMIAIGDASVTWTRCPADPSALPELGSAEPAPQDPGPQDPGPQDPGPHDPGPQDSGPEELGARDPDRN